MLTAPGGAKRPPALRRLNVPRPIEVRTGVPHPDPAEPGGAGGEAAPPTALRRGDRWLAVVELLDRYRTDDRWWTAEPIARTYYELLLEDGRAVAVFHDDVHDAWYEQRYG